MTPAQDQRVPVRLWTGTASLVLVRILGTLSGFAALALLARFLDGETFGTLTFYLALLLLLESFVDAGTSSAAVQRGANDDEELAACVRAGRSVRLSAALLGGSSVTLLAWFQDPELAVWIAAAAFCSLTRTLELSAAVFHARIRWNVPAIVRGLVAVLRLTAVVLLWRADVRSAGAYLFTHACLGALGNVLLHWIARRQLKPTAKVATGFLSIALPLAVIGVAQQAYFYADNLVVRELTGSVELGRYNAAVRIFSFLVLVAGLASNAALPWLTQRARAGDLGAATKRLSRPLLAGAALVLVPLFPLADEVLELLFGKEFGQAASSLRWLVAAAAVVYVGAGLVTAVLASGRVVALVAVVLGGLALNLVGNLWLVPELGIEGAAVATFATELFVTVASWGVLFGLPSRPAPGQFQEGR